MCCAEAAAGGVGEGAENDTRLLEVARASLAHGVTHGEPLPVDPADFPLELRAPGACFVTLRRGGALRGCVGSLEASAPLVVETARNAFRAGFADPRFEPLRREELPGLEVHVSLLGPLVPLEVTSEEALLRALRPGTDGLLLSGAGVRATFLPAVWGELPEPAGFVGALKRKAGLPGAAWSSAWRWDRFEAREIG